MTSSLGPTGLMVDSLNTIIANLTASLQAIYGPDINVNSNSPDGQLINIFAQNVEDLLELLESVYNTFGYETAYGTQLDNRLAILGLARQQGTYTTTPVSITTHQALTLYGLDQTVNPAFSVADNAGNQYQLVTTYSFGSAGTESLTFQAVNIGAVQVTANTITNQATTVLGVTAVNNPTTSGTVTGVNEETDTQYKVRAAQSFALASTGPADAINAQLLNTPGIVDASVIENYTGSTVGGVPAHSIWCIVRGGTAIDIAQAIYAKDAGMRNDRWPVLRDYSSKWDDLYSFMGQRFLTTALYRLWGPMARRNDAF